jgi:hypothetical protein
MKKEIVYTDKYALILSDEIPTKVYYDTYIHQLKHTGGAEYGESSIAKKVIGHLPLTDDAPILEGVPLLPPLPTRPTHFESWMQEIQCPDNRQGCLVAHYSSKTTNSQGQEELIGKYLIK